MKKKIFNPLVQTLKLFTMILLSFFLSFHFLLTTTKPVKADTLANIGYPFNKGETWYVYQGYNTGGFPGGTHYDDHSKTPPYYEKYAFDLVKDIHNADSTGGANVIAAATGTIYSVITDVIENGNHLGGQVAERLADGYVIIYLHLANISVVLGKVNAGQQVGVVGVENQVE